MFGLGKNRDKLTYKVEPPFDEIPSGWYVYNLSQSPKTRFWSCKFIHEDCFIEDAEWVRFVEVKDYETATEAVQAALNSVQNGGIQRKLLYSDTCA